MGTNWSSLDREPCPDPWWPNPQPITRPDATNNLQMAGEEEAAVATTKKGGGRVNQEELEVFKQELARKRALRHEALAALQAEMKELRKRVEEERSLKEKAEEERDKLRTSSEEEVRVQLERERDEKKKLLDEKEALLKEVEEKEGLERQVQALKDVSQIGKEMLRIRELQVKELKKKLVEINMSSVMAPPEDLRVEYETQIENIRKLRTLYEERAAATLLEHRREMEREQARIVVLETKMSELQKELEEYKEAKTELEAKIEKLEKMIQHKEDELETTKDDLFSSTVQNKSLNTQMALINNLFSQMLVSPKVDLDRLIRLLKENHGLITDLTEKGDSNEVAALLVDLAGQIEKEQEAEQKQKENSDILGENVESQSEIASNLSKVWRVMIELLSHHQNQSHTELAGGAESCYKCIETPTGPRSVISVSQTFLTLKDLILEKNRLVKEVGRLKTLNNHLEYRLGSQEKRLSVVTTELRKTWGVVNKLRAQHKQLHTHEKILRYELQQKRCMLTELKEELEHCRDKWDRARQKNSQTEEDWKKLRKEFAARKTRKESNSAESGFEEEDIAQSPPSEPAILGTDLFKLTPNDGSEPELSEEDIDHSDGNSFDTVIDLLDIACLENQTESETRIPFVLCEVPSETSQISPSLLPLTDGEFTEGLDQIESEDLAAVLDIQYQNQLLGADYNLSLPSSSGSSPIPTENDDFASSEMDISEDSSSSNDNHIYSPPLPNVNQNISEDTLLFGSNSSINVSKFLDGLFVDKTQNEIQTTQRLSLTVPSTSQTNENDTATPLANNENCYQFSIDSATPLVNNESCFEFPVNTLHVKSNTAKSTGMDHVKQWVNKSQSPLQGNIVDKEETINKQSSSSSSESGTKTQEEILKSREDRLKKLEQQCRSLVSNVMSTSFRNEIISNKLQELHLSYGSSEEVSDIEEETVLKGQESNDLGAIDATQQFDNKSLSMAEGVPSEIPIFCENFKTQKEEALCSSKTDHQSVQALRQSQGKTPEEILEARAARLQRLEDQCKTLFSKMSATSSRSVVISNKLDELHETYGPCEQATEQSPSKVLLEKRKSLNSENTGSRLNETKSIIKGENKDSKPPDLASESKEILNNCCPPGPSQESVTITTEEPKKDRTPEDILKARAERFKRLEDQCKSLVSKMTATSLRSEIISNKLDELHSCYGSSEDASDNDEHSSTSREGDRRRNTPSSSPRYSRKLAQISEKNKQTNTFLPENEDVVREETTNGRTALPQATIMEEVNMIHTNLDCTDRSKRTSEEVLQERAQRLDLHYRVALPQETILEEENTIPIHQNVDNTVRSNRTPEEVLQARAQRLNKLEEQCKSLFSQMSATSQRSDVISNRLEELHEQYGQSSASEQIRPVTDVTDTENTRHQLQSTQAHQIPSTNIDNHSSETRNESQCTSKEPPSQENNDEKHNQQFK